MLKKITSSIKMPVWAGTADNTTRWLDLDVRDKILDGKLYDHLPHAFYDESEGAGPGTRLIPIAERRPSSQFNVSRMVGRWSARKLWAGRHAPKVQHTDDDAQQSINRLLTNACFFPTMMDATLRGSVGAVAVTFRVEQIAGHDPQVKLKVWRARDCIPSFDTMGNLSNLRVAYTVSGQGFKAIGWQGGEINARKRYWFIRDFKAESDVTYQPIDEQDWNPVDNACKEGCELKPWDDPKMTVQHGLGFVQGVWIQNLAGGCEPDGACTWEDAIGMAIEMDYLLSQTGRGVRYNCAPQLVVIGNFMGAPPSEEGQAPAVTRGPVGYLHLTAAYKAQEGGDTLGGGDAKLLEMSGQGTDAAIKFINQLRNMALEQISAARKDPEKLKAPLSGRAMEFLDEDSHDLVMELRGQYGEHGALVLIRKITRAAFADVDESLITLRWPRLYMATPEDVQNLLPAIVQAVTPIADPSTAVPATPGEGGSAGSPPKSIGSVMELAEAQEYVRNMLDMEAWTGAEEPDSGDQAPPGGSGASEPEPAEGNSDTAGDLITGAIGRRR